MTTIIVGNQVELILESILDDLVEAILEGEELQDERAENGFGLEYMIAELRAVAGDDGAIHAEDIAVVVDPAGFIHLRQLTSVVMDD
jgi:hypothetical protein